MAHYLVRAGFVWKTLRQLRHLLDSGEIISMQPFGRALEYSLRNAKYEPSSGLGVWIEEDYCTPPLAMEREAILDQYFRIEEIENVNLSDGWRRVAHLPSLWTPVPGLPRREGERPLTRKGMPHQQLTQNPPTKVYDLLAEKIFSLPYVEEDLSIVSVPGARALVLNPTAAKGPREAFVFDSTEFAHLHPPHDSSLHLSLPKPWVGEVLEKGWGEPHPLAGTIIPDNYVMVYAPRTNEEVDIVYEVVLLSYWWARGAIIPYKP